MVKATTDRLTEPNAITFKSSDNEESKPVTFMPSVNSVLFLGERMHQDQFIQYTGLALRVTYNTVDSYLYGKFRELVDQWKADSRYVSSLTDLENHEAYQNIIRLGPSVIPLVIDEMAREPDWWFMALDSLVDDPPELNGLEGDLDGMASAWADWGKAHGYSL